MFPNHRAYMNPTIESSNKLYRGTPPPHELLHHRSIDSQSSVGGSGSKASHVEMGVVVSILDCGYRWAYCGGNIVSVQSRRQSRRRYNVCASDLGGCVSECCNTDKVRIRCHVHIRNESADIFFQGRDLIFHVSSLTQQHSSSKLMSPKMHLSRMRKLKEIAKD